MNKNIKWCDIKIGTKLSWIDGMGIETTGVVQLDANNQFIVATNTSLIPANLLLSVNNTVNIVAPKITIFERNRILVKEAQTSAPFVMIRKLQEALEQTSGRFERLVNESHHCWPEHVEVRFIEQVILADPQ